MKKITKEVITKQEVFIAYDGKEFNNEADCVKWESSYKATVMTSFCAEVPQFSLGEDTCMCKNGFEDNEVLIVKPRNMNDIVLTNAFLQIINKKADVLPFDLIGKVVLLYLGYNREDFYGYVPLENHMKDIDRRREEFATLISKKFSVTP